MTKKKSSILSNSEQVRPEREKLKNDKSAVVVEDSIFFEGGGEREAKHICAKENIRDLENKRK